MAIDRNKIIAEAQKYIQKGQLKKAIREYYRILEAEPDDVRLLLKIGDLQARDGQAREAVRTYQEVADYYVVNGFFLKAVAVYKQLLRLEPDAVSVKLNLADLYFQLGLVSDAMAQFAAVAAIYQQTDRLPEYLQTLARMTEVDPANVGTRIKLAEQFVKTGDEEGAALHFAEVLRLLDDAGRFDEYAKVAERYLHLRPEDLNVTHRLVRVLLDTERAPRALGRLQSVFRTHMWDSPCVDLLVETLEALGQVALAVPALREIAVRAEEAGRHAAAAQAWRALLAIAPQDPDARAALQLDEEEDEPLLTLDLLEPERPAANSSGASRVAPAPDDEATAAIEKIVSETDIYLKYNLFAKADEHLTRALELDPWHVEALARHAAVLEQLDRADEAAEAMARALHSARVREPGRVDALTASLRVLAPQHAALHEDSGDAAQDDVVVFETLEPIEMEILAHEDHEADDDDALLTFEADEHSSPPPPLLPEPAERSGIFQEFDALFEGVTSESDLDAGESALDDDKSFIRDLDSLFDEPGEGAALDGVRFDDFDGVEVPEELAALLDDAAEQAAAGEYALAHQALMELMGEFPEHAEIILSRMGELDAGDADGSASGDAQVTFDLFGHDDDDADDESTPDADAIPLKTQSAEEDDELLMEFEVDDDEDDADQEIDLEPLDEMPFSLEPASTDEALLFALTGSPADQEDTPSGDAPAALPDLGPRIPTPGAIVERTRANGRQTMQRAELDSARVPVLSGDFAAVPDDDNSEPELSFDGTDSFPVNDPGSTAGPSHRAPHPAEGSGILRLEQREERAPVAAAEDPDAYLTAVLEASQLSDPDDSDDLLPDADAPFGRVSTAANVRFYPVEATLAHDPEGSLASAIRMRRAGRTMEALDALQDEIFGDNPVAAAFESAWANLELGQYMYAVESLQQLQQSPGLSEDDRAAIQYLMGIAFEALSLVDDAQRIFSNLHELRTRQFPDAVIRLARL